MSAPKQTPEVTQRSQPAVGIDDLTASPAWRKRVGEALVAGHQNPPVDSEIDALVEEVLEARMELDRALAERAAGARPRPSEIAQDSRDKAAAIRECVQIVRAEIDALYPPELVSTATPQSGSVPRSASPPSLAAVVQVERRRWEGVVRCLEDLAGDLAAAPLGGPRQGMIGPPSAFHATPAMLKDKFAARLLSVWSCARGVAVRDIKIGSADYRVGFVGFAAAAVSPLTGEEGEETVALSTLRRHAREVRRSVGDYGTGYLEALVQIVR